MFIVIHFYCICGWLKITTDSLPLLLSRDGAYFDSSMSTRTRDWPEPGFDQQTRGWGTAEIRSNRGGSGPAFSGTGNGQNFLSVIGCRATCHLPRSIAAWGLQSWELSGETVGRGLGRRQLRSQGKKKRFSHQHLGFCWVKKEWILPLVRNPPHSRECAEI